MPKYILLANFTDQGIRNIRGTISRAEAFQAMAEKSGIVMKELCWTLGRYDVVAVFEAADDESAAALALSASSLGNTRCETMNLDRFVGTRGIEIVGASRKVRRDVPKS